MKKLSSTEKACLGIVTISQCAILLFCASIVFTFSKKIDTLDARIELLRIEIRNLEQRPVTIEIHKSFLDGK